MIEKKAKIVPVTVDNGAKFSKLKELSKSNELINAWDVNFTSFKNTEKKNIVRPI